MHHLLVLCILLGSTTALAQPMAQIKEKTQAQPPQRWGLRLLATSVEGGISVTNASRGSGYGLGIDLQLAPSFGLSLEVDTIDYSDSARKDLRVRIRERFDLINIRRLTGYTMISIGVTRARVPMMHGQVVAHRFDSETGLGARLRLTKGISLFGEFGLGWGRWIDEAPSVLPLVPQSTAEGYAEMRAGLKIDF